MSKKRQTAPPTTAEMEKVCLHCAFFEAHKLKWPQWSPNDDDEHQDAFNDLVRSASKVVAEIFTMLSPMDQMQFMHRVMQQYAHMTGVGEDAKPVTLSEAFEMLKAAASIKH